MSKPEPSPEPGDVDLAARISAACVHTPRGEMACLRCFAIALKAEREDQREQDAVVLDEKVDPEERLLRKLTSEVVRARVNGRIYAYRNGAAAIRSGGSRPRPVEGE